MTVPMLDEMIQLSAAHGAQGGRGRHGPPRPAQRARAQPRPPLRDDLRRVRGRLDARGGHDDPAGRHGRRQVPPRRAGQLRPARRRRDPRQPRVQPVAPRVRAPGRRGRHARGADARARARTAHRDTNRAVPVVLHGDAAFPGQGVVSETLNLQALDGYKVGGTLHLIQNNQVGFTTDPEDARSTRWASDLAKGFDCPIIHVNADDVAACISAVRLAFAFRQEFGHDVVIDLIGYRRFGHNEADEPAYTQPEMYATIKSKKRVSELWAERLRRAGRHHPGRGRAAAPGGLGPPHAAAPASSRRSIKAVGRGDQAEQRHGRVPARPHAEPRGRATAVDGRAAARAQRGAAARARGLHGPPQARQAARAPARGARRRRRHRLGARRGAGLRLAADRGHARPPDRPGHRARHVQPAPPRPARRQDGPDAQPDPAACRARRRRSSCTTRPLSELACLGFEYGYSQEAPETLVLWEAQFGDFVNCAQVIIDQFIVSGLAKWGQTSRLTLLLPHGYEGSGPSTPARAWSASSRWPPRATSASPTRRRRRSTSTCCAARRASPSSARSS